MPESKQPTRFGCVVENTRRVLVKLAEGVCQKRFIELLNQRHVRLNGEQLIDGYSGKLLGRRVVAVNTCDYKIAADQCPLHELDAIDIYDFDYNQI